MISLAGQCQGEDPYAEVKAAFADGGLQFQPLMAGEWVDWPVESEPTWVGFLPVAGYRRRPKPDALETPPSVLQQHAEMLAADDKVQHSDKPGIETEHARKIRDAFFGSLQKVISPPPSKPKAPDGFEVLAPMSGRVGGRWGL